MLKAYELLLFFSVQKKACAEHCGCTSCFPWRCRQCFRAVLAIKSAEPHLREKLAKMINSLNSHLTHRDSPGHGTLHFALLPSLPLPMRLCNIRFIAQCLNRHINITNGLRRAWNYLLSDELKPYWLSIRYSLHSRQFAAWFTEWLTVLKNRWINEWMYQYNKRWWNELEIEVQTFSQQFHGQDTSYQRLKKSHLNQLSDVVPTVRWVSDLL